MGKIKVLVPDNYNEDLSEPDEAAWVLQELQSKAKRAIQMMDAGMYTEEELGELTAVGIELKFQAMDHVQPEKEVSEKPF